MEGVGWFDAEGLCTPPRVVGTLFSDARYQSKKGIGWGTPYLGLESIDSLFLQIRRLITLIWAKRDFLVFVWTIFHFFGIAEVFIVVRDIFQI